jgi:hypothetical protein
MTDVKKHSVLVVLAAWLIIVAFFMVLNRTLDLEVFFVLSLNGLLFVVVLFDGNTPVRATCATLTFSVRQGPFSLPG